MVELFFSKYPLDRGAHKCVNIFILIQYKINKSDLKKYFELCIHEILNFNIETGFWTLVLIRGAQIQKNKK